MPLSNNNNYRPALSFRTTVVFCTGFLAGIYFCSWHAVYECSIVSHQQHCESLFLKNQQQPAIHVNNKDGRAQNGSAIHRVFPDSMRNLVVGMGRVSRDEFAQRFDIGYAIDKSFEHNNEVLILYGSEQSLPRSHTTTLDDDDVVPMHTVDDAVENCNLLKVVLTDPKPPEKEQKGAHKQCIAIMGQWESYHVHKYEKRKSDLVYTYAHHKKVAPSVEETKASNQALVTYLSVYEDVQNKLRPIAEKVARGGGGGGGDQPGPIIVMVANHGHFRFFLNFYCSAHARGLDISRVLLFATDKETFKLATSMNIAVFFDDRVFASIPSDAAVNYHDDNYGRIMMSKIYCVHLVNSLGYDLLFQDLDLVWYRDPLPYFGALEDAGPNSFDMYFQHDGSHHPKRFAPLAANTGFYYVRHNARTEHFFSVFVRMGDLVLTDKSHQAAFTTLANEHMSLRGLRIKVLAGEDTNRFMSGAQIHNTPKRLKQLLHDTHIPYIFHANWMAGKDKQPALKELRNWFVNDKCSGGNKGLIIVNSSTGHLDEGCCLAEPAEP
jgi:hypothetical protein